MRRGIASAVAVTALFIAALSYYAACFMAGLLAFVLFWHRGDLNAAWRALFIARNPRSRSGRTRPRTPARLYERSNSPGTQNLWPRLQIYEKPLLNQQVRWGMV